MGAIHAASRRNREKRIVKNTSAKPLSPTKRAPSRCSSNDSSMHDLSSCETASTSSVGSKPSILSQVKQQVQDTSCVFKKYRQALSKNMMKGFRSVSGTSTSSGKEFKDQPQATSDEATTVVWASEQSDPAWLTTVAQMGFDRSQVLEAAGSLGEQPTSSQIDDLVQVLLVMNTSKTSAACDAPVHVLPADTSSAHSLPSSSPPDHEASVGLGRQWLDLQRSSIAAAPQCAATPQAIEQMPPMPEMSAVGSVEFEMAVDKSRVLHAPPPMPVATRLALEQMGFTAAAIREAAGLLGPDAQFNDLCELLVAMAGKKNSCMSGPSMSACPAASEAVQAADALQNRLAEEAARAGATAMVALDEEDEKAASAGQLGNAAVEQERGSRMLASTVVAMIVAKASEKVSQMEKERLAEKKGGDESSVLSPKKGGA